MLPYMNAEITKKLSKVYQTGRSIQLLELDAVNHSSIQKGQESLSSLDKEILVFLFTLINELSNVVLSEDQWFLAEEAATMRCINLGIKPDSILTIKDKVRNIRKRNIEANPIASMF